MTAKRKSPISRPIRKAPWPSPPEEEDEEAALTSLSPDAIVHTPSENRGRRSLRFPHLNITATARELGITKTHLSKVLSGQSRPSIKLALQLTGVLKRDLLYVISLYNNGDNQSELSLGNKASRKKAS
jgi:plasmid maintenance system antidote protein VapI